MLMVNVRGCHKIARERRSGLLEVTIPGAHTDGGDLRLRQGEQNTWWAYSPSIRAYMPFAPSAELAGDLIALECEFRANELIAWQYRSHAFPALASASARRVSQARVAELERQQHCLCSEVEPLLQEDTEGLAGGLP